MERSKAKADKFRFIDEEKREKVIFSLKCIFSCAVGLLLARAKIFGSLSPFPLPPGHMRSRHRSARSSAICYPSQGRRG